MLSNGKIFPLNNMGNQFFGENGQSGCLIELGWSLIGLVGLPEVKHDLKDLKIWKISINLHISKQNFFTCYPMGKFPIG